MDADHFKRLISPAINQVVMVGDKVVKEVRIEPDRVVIIPEEGEDVR